MFRFIMLHGITKEHGVRSVISKGRFGSCRPAAGLLLPVARCNTHASWLRSSAAEGRQVSGNEILSHAAAVHGITAHRHGNKEQQCCSHAAVTNSQTVAALRSQQQAVNPYPRVRAVCSCGQAPSTCEYSAVALHSKAAGAAEMSVYSAHGMRRASLVPITTAPHLAAGVVSNLQAVPQYLAPGSSSSAAAAVGAAAVGTVASGRYLACSTQQAASIPTVAQTRHHSVISAVPATAAGAGRGWSTGQQQGAAKQYSAASTGNHSRADVDGQRSAVSQLSEEETYEALHNQLARKWATENPGWDESLLPRLNPGPNRDASLIRCPRCDNGSRQENCFWVNVQPDAILWFCHRANCGYKGNVKLQAEFAPRSSTSNHAAHAVPWAGAPVQGQPRPKSQAVIAHSAAAPWPQQQEQTRDRPPPGRNFEPLSAELLQWFETRGISIETLQRNGVMMERVFSIQQRQVAPFIAFPFYKNGSIVNVKYRALGKQFQQMPGGEQIFYGYDDAKGAAELIIVEGEMDKLAVEEALTVAAKQQLLLQQKEDHNSSSSEVSSGSSSSSSVPRQRPLWWRLGRRTAVLSVPAGAHAAGSSNLEGKLRYLDTCSDLLNAAQRVVIAVDNDGPGLALAEELVRRIGRAKCWKVTWPTGPRDSLAAAPAAAAAGSQGAAVTAPAAAGAAGSNGTLADAVGVAVPSADMAAGLSDQWFRKDANEVLVADGPEVLLRYIDDAQQLPIQGLFPLDEFYQEVYDLYKQGAKGLNFGVSTGWDSLDEFYKVVPGELTLVTGYPGSGKSEWLDALTVNLAKTQDWAIALCSLENRPLQHAVKLMEKDAGLPFAESRNSHGKIRMAEKDMLTSFLWIDEHFHIIQRPKDAAPGIDYILDRARAAVMRYGIRGLVIDPYNELDHSRRSEMTETEHISRMLTKIKRFAQAYDCHVWLVAHPRTVYVPSGESQPPPTLYDISGSANFVNKADNGVIVHRPWVPGREGGDPMLVHLLIRKVRNKLAGGIGECYLRYEPDTGRYVDDVKQHQD